jgi:hypothetical protein
MWDDDSNLRLDGERPRRWDLEDEPKNLLTDWPAPGQRPPEPPQPAQKPPRPPMRLLTDADAEEAAPDAEQSPKFDLLAGIRAYAKWLERSLSDDNE